MSSIQSTLEALSSVDSLVGTLKACIWKQDKIIREQREEIENLTSLVRELEKERKELRRHIAKERTNGSNSNADEIKTPDEKDSKIKDSQKSFETPSERLPSTEGSENTPEVFTTPEPLRSPIITITPDPPAGTPKSEKKDIFKTSVKRNDSITRQKSFNRKYELSPELQERSVMFLERQYGGKLKAHHAARVIQAYYRTYRMNKQFKRMRTHSFTPGKDSFRSKSNSDPRSSATSPTAVNSESQVTPVLRIKKKKSGDKRVKSILIIDNINSFPGGEVQRYSTEFLPSDLTSIFASMTPQSSDAKSEQKELPDEKANARLGSVTSETEHYVKVEIVDNIETLPSAAGDVSNQVPNGDLCKSSRRETFHEDGSVIESDESGDEMTRQDLSSVDSLDGLCPSSGPASTDDDSLSLYSEFEPKPQKLETRIGINHFNRKPEKGINYLVTHQVLEDNPEMVAKFLLTEPGISKQKLGEYLGNLQNEFNMEVLKYFVENLDFTGMEVDEALRVYQTCFILPGEAQKIEKLMQDFAEHYVNCNPSTEKGAVDAILILAFAIVMLNTDLHSPNVKRRMTEMDFINNLRGTNNGGDFPQESLLAIYNRIKKKAFVTGKDHVSAVQKLAKKIVGTKSPWTTLAALHRQLRMLTPLYIIRDPNKKEKPHPRTIFLFNDMLVAAKERGRAGRSEGIHYYSFKQSFSLCGLKVTTFSNDYYAFGIQIYSKLDSKILAHFNARDEQIRKVFFDELLDCIEETNEMESDRITTEKQKHLGARFNRSGVDLSRSSLTLPKKPKKPTPDTISLIDSSSSMESLSTAGLLGSKQLSSSLLNINENTEFTSELKKSSSISSLDSAFTDGLINGGPGKIEKFGGKTKREKGKRRKSESKDTDSDRTISEDLHSSTFHRGGIFRKWRHRHNTKSMSRRPSPKMSPIATPVERKYSTPT